MIAIGGAIGTGLFNGSGKTIHLAGPSIILIYVIIGFFLYFVMRAMGEQLLSNLEYKSFRDIAEDQLGPWAGFFSGWTYWLCWIVIGMADITAVTNYVLWWFPNIPKFLPAVLLVLLLFGLNVVAVRLFGEIEFWFALIKVIAIVVLIVVAVVLVIMGFHSNLDTLIGSHRVGDAYQAIRDTLTQAYPNGANASLGNLLNSGHGGIFPNGFNGFLGGFQIAFYAFVGIELAGTASAETKDPLRTLPKAINAIPIRVVLFYVFALSAIMSVTPYLAIDPDHSPFVNMFALTGLGFAASLINFVVLTSAASSMNSGIYSTSRMLFGLALTRFAPKAFGKLSKSHVPANALLFSSLCVLPGVALLYASGSIMDAFTYATSAANVLFIFVWTLIMLSYLHFRKKHADLHDNSVYKMPWGVPMSYVVMVFFVVMLVILCLDKVTLIGAATTLIWFAGLTVVYVLRRRHQDVLADR
jgi:D-serine/D-alanine/glycine transporter